jgi:hypothetical protein
MTSRCMLCWTRGLLVSCPFVMRVSGRHMMVQSTWSTPKRGGVRKGQGRAPGTRWKWIEYLVGPVGEKVIPLLPTPWRHAAADVWVLATMLGLVSVVRLYVILPQSSYLSCQFEPVMTFHPFLLPSSAFVPIHILAYHLFSLVEANIPFALPIPLLPLSDTSSNSSTH